MATFVALYGKPSDAEGFEEHLRSTHLPIVRSWPGVTAVRTRRFSATPRGGEPAYHLIVEADFVTDEEMAAALRSESGAASARDAMAMAEQFGVTPTMMLGAELPGA